MSELPSSALENIYWSCSRKRWESAEAFSEAINRYHIDVVNIDTWAPDKVALPTDRVRISFRCWNKAGSEDYEPQLELESDHPEHFTQLDLLYKLCDGIADHLVEHDRYLYDHCFFEGIGLFSGDPGDRAPLYFVHFGS